LCIHINATCDGLVCFYVRTILTAVKEAEVKDKRDNKTVASISQDIRHLEPTILSKCVTYTTGCEICPMINFTLVDGTVRLLIFRYLRNSYTIVPTLSINVQTFRIMCIPCVVLI
jgi:hypothetical protein